MQGYNHPFILGRTHIFEQEIQAAQLPVEDIRYYPELKSLPLSTVEKLFTNQGSHASARH